MRWITKKEQSIRNLTFISPRAKSTLLLLTCTSIAYPVSGMAAVQVFQHCNYTGWQTTLGEGSHTRSALVSAGGIDNDASSLRIPAGYKVSLYDSDNLTGTPVVLTGDTGCLVGNNFNDRLSSLKVEKTTTPTNSTYGTQPIGSTSVEFYVMSNAWADVHYSLNGGPQQNLRMTQNGGRNTYVIRGLKSGDRVSYNFTYWTGSFAVDTPVSVYTHAGDTTGGTNGTGNGLAASYYNGLNFETLVGSRTDATLNMNWNNGSPMNGVNSDRFTARWRGQIEPRFTDNYTFHINSDNGRRVWVDGRLIIDRWVDDWNIEYTGGIALTAGRKYDIVVEYFENWGGANIKFEWSSPRQQREIVPQSQLYASATPPPPPPPPPAASVTPLYNASTALEPNTQFDRGDALVTRFSDRPRTRHAREDQFQSYDHYIKFYFEHRSSNIEIVDYVAKGGDRIEMNVRTLWRLDDREAENRWWYLGRNTVAHYVGNGIMTYLGFDGVYHRYTKTDNVNRQFNREIRVGDRLEFEISQFSTSDIPRGQANYYGTTFLYIVGEGIVPWYTENAGEFVAGAADFQEDSRKIPESYWLGGKTTLHYQYTNEPNDHFMQMATNLGYNNGQKFLLGRRVHHSAVTDGMHDEDAANGSHPGMAGLVGSRYINARCTDCHKRNGSAPVAPNGELLDRWVFKVGDANGNPHPDLGRVLQPKGDSEGGVSIAFWTENNGLRKPTYQFNGITPPTFSARIAPRLVGLGLLEAIPESTVLAKEDPNDANGDGISGRANRIPDPLNANVTRLGRFGWKAGTTSVKHQAAAALNTDMGVRSSVMPNPDCGASQPNCGNTSRMISNQHLDELVVYLSTLGVRPQRGIESGFVDQTINQGKQKFRDIGCTSCHTETVQTSAFHPLAEVRNQTIHPYSDLLLHDMGAGLADNLGEGNASGREWRTTPLWGLGLAACVTGGVTNPSGREGGEVCTPHRAYLHDGRARTIEEAILWHGGEGERAKNAYQGMTDTDKRALLRFLEAL